MKKIKKLLVLLAGIVTVVCLSAALAACSADDVDGNTYAFDSVSISVSSDVADLMPDGMLEEMEQSYAEEFDGITISFADGMATMTYPGEEPSSIEYTQDGNKITVEGGSFNVDGDELVISETQDGVTVKIIFKKV